jgi:hypothetical protein
LQAVFGMVSPFGWLFSSDDGIVINMATQVVDARFDQPGVALGLRQDVRAQQHGLRVPR